MVKETYNNQLRRQCMDIPGLARPQVAGALKGIEENIPEDVMKKVRNVIVTGCGDSYMASIVSIPAFRRYAGKFGNQFSSMRAIDAARFLDMGKLDTDATMIAAVSCSGGPARIKEILQRGNYYNCETVAVTNNPDSPAGKEAKYDLLTNTPEFPEPGPGLRNYFASMTGLFLLAAKMGELKGCCEKGSVSALSDAIVKNAEQWKDAVDKIDDQMFEIANKWKTFRNFDCIGDDVEYSSAFFAGAKIVETSGYQINVDDSEDWCHVGFFQRNPRKIGTIIVTDKNAQDRSRVSETISQAVGIHRPILLITNGTKEEFNITDGVDVCTIPDAPEGFEFLLPMTAFLPGAILAGYLSALNNESYFRSMTAYSERGAWDIPSNNTIKTSTIVII